MKKLLFTFLTFCIFLTACTNDKRTEIIGGADGPTAIMVSEKGENAMYQQITPEAAKEIMDSQENIVILDVREQEEFDEGHIKDAILLPYTEIDSKAEELLPDKNQTILVYCRSGRRSKIASDSLVKLGYTNIKEFGGIVDWPYDTEK